MRALRFWQGTGPAARAPAAEPATDELRLWVHLGSRSAGLLPPLISRIEALAEMPVRTVLTGTPQPLDPAPRLPLPEADDTPGFLAAHGIAAVLWAAPPLGPVRLDAALARPVIVLPMPDPVAAIPGGPLRRRAAGDALGRCTLLAATAEEARALRRVSRAGLRVTAIGPMQDGVAVPGHDEGRRAGLAAGLAGRPVWFATACPPETRGAVLDAHAALMARVHRAVLAMEAPGAAAGAGADPQDGVIHVPEGAERGLWYRIAPLTLMADTFGPGGTADPLAPAALGSAVLHGPAPSERDGAYARLAAAGAARRIPGPGAIAAAVEDMLQPETAARQAGAAWAEVTRGAEGTDRAAAAVIQALEDAGIL